MLGERGGGGTQEVVGLGGGETVEGRLRGVTGKDEKELDINFNPIPEGFRIPGGFVIFESSSLSFAGTSNPKLLTRYGAGGKTGGDRITSGR